jgi:hypothetical protein
MRWAVEYTTPTNMIGLCIFTAANEEEAQAYIIDMITRHGYTNVFNLNQLQNGAGIEELYRLFPRLASIVKSNGIPI